MGSASGSLNQQTKEEQMRLFTVAIQRKPFSRTTRILVYVNEDQNVWTFTLSNKFREIRSIVYHGTNPDRFAKHHFPSFF